MRFLLSTLVVILTVTITQAQVTKEKEKAIHHYVKGEQNLEVSNYNKAIVHYEEALFWFAQDPSVEDSHYVQSWLSLAYSYASTGDTTTSLFFVEKALGHFDQANLWDEEKWKQILSDTYRMNGLDKKAEKILARL